MICGRSAWSIEATSGPSRDVAPERPAAGGDWRGRREGAIAELLPRPRTSPGGDQRPPISGGMLRGGPLLEELEVAVELPLRDLLVGGLHLAALALDEVVEVVAG